MIKFSYNGMTITIYRTWWRRLAYAPFEMGLAIFAIYSGISGLCNFGASNEIFAEAVHLPSVFNLVFVFAGLAMIFGNTYRFRGLEGIGLYSLLGALATRSIIILLSTGWNVTSHNLLALCLINIVSSVIRLFMLNQVEEYTISK